MTSPQKLLMLVLPLAIACGGATTTLKDTGAGSEHRVVDVKVNWLKAPLGLTSTPRFSWRLQSEAAGAAQTAYQIVAAVTPEGITGGQGLLWNTGKVASHANVGVVWAGPALTSRQRVFVAVRVWNQADNLSAWSEPTSFEMGLLQGTDWTAKWITRPTDATESPLAVLQAAAWIWHPDENAKKAAPAAHRWFRNEFAMPLGAQVQKASLLVGANDSADVFVNGKKVFSVDAGDVSEAVDVTSLLHAGRNVLGADVYNKGGPAGLLASLQLVTRDGGGFAINTGDVGWQAAKQPSSGWLNVGSPAGFVAAEQVAKWDEPPFDGRPRTDAWAAPAPYFFKEFAAPEQIKSARAYISGLGYYELYINGRRVGDHVLDPGYTDYSKNVQYVVHDITRLLDPNKNAVGVILGNGFYNQHARDPVGFATAPWRDNPKLLLQIEVTTQSGNRFVVATDKTWKVTEGPVRFDGIRNGEHYDARLEKADFARVGFVDPKARDVELAATPKGPLLGQEHPPIRVLETLPSRSVKQVGPVAVFDVGQNIAGWARLHVQGTAGTKLVIRYGESLDANGRVDQSIGGWLRQGRFQTDEYIMRGGSEEIWEPRFVYHGFRYVEVQGLPGTPTTNNVEARVIHTDFESIGTLETSDALVNSIHQATRWSYIANFQGIPTDCPQREKNGWTADAHLAMDAGAFNFENTAGYLKWIRDLVSAQNSKGQLPGIVPSSGWGFNEWSGPSWELALFVVPWSLYTFNGDVLPLQLAWPAQERYLAYLRSIEKDGVVDVGLGDWVPWQTKTAVAITSTASYRWAAHLAAKTAQALRLLEAAKRYNALADHVSQGFQRAFVNASTGQVGSDEQTALAVALTHDLVPQTLRAATAARLIKSLEATDFHPDTGVIGAKAVLRALADTGHMDVAYKVASRRTAPSWGYWIDQGATTLWEDWKGKESRNHIFFGDIDAWYYEYLAGIKPDDQAPGFEHFTMAPQVPAGLDAVEAHVNTVRGTVGSQWKREGNGVRFAFAVPPSANATIVIPAEAGTTALFNNRPLASATELAVKKLPEGGWQLQVRAGRYTVITSGAN
ncbi:MAG: family 78 glycoside hydrolase catalytic domain [Deltaproteobacteria bacterium]|nr:family 78 glycoside hydrolase catalytic domain [Deltaproteobacteria bacterium]